MARIKDPLQAHIDALTTELERMRESAMRRAGYTSFGQREIASFHGRIGGKNNDYVDSIRQVFLSPQQFIGEWKQGALEKAEAKDRYELRTYGCRYQNTAAHVILRMLQDSVTARYIDLFLERNFYRQYHARIREKPEDALWEIWFGAKNQEFGLFIAPRFKCGVWENDVSEIRRVTFDYWTVAHVLHSGFLIPGKDDRLETPTLDHLFQIYHHCLIRSTGSEYSQAFARKYEEYVRASDDPESIPFMIPEFRYEGSTGPHKYRLDFTILSASRHLKIGIELSPWSSHGRVRDKRKLREMGGEAAIESERLRKWESEIRKRNDYFKKFGITTLTFTDSDLADLDTAFSQSVTDYLSCADQDNIAVPRVAEAIARYAFQD